MKITICGSIAFYDQMFEVKKELEALGHEVCVPYAEFTDGAGNAITIPKAYASRKDAGQDDAWIWDEKEKAIQSHFKKVVWADVILVLNYDKNDIPGYIGGNTLMEMGLALYVHKPIYLYNDIPKMSYTEEIRAMKPIVVHGKLKNIV